MEYCKTKARKHTCDLMRLGFRVVTLLSVSDEVAQMDQSAHTEDAIKRDQTVEHPFRSEHKVKVCIKKKP